MLILLHLAAAGLYTALAVYFWRTRWTAASATGTRRGLDNAERAGVLAALILHLWLLDGAAFDAGRMRFGFGLAAGHALQGACKNNRFTCDR